jgi:hypothetical protein
MPPRLARNDGTEHGVPACADRSCSHSINTGAAKGMIAREIVDDLEAALEQFRETIKSSLWVPGQARNDEILEIPIGRNI